MTAYVSLIFAAMLVAVVPATGYFAGPARAGDSVTYEIVTTTGERPQETPNFAELVIKWTKSSRLYARLADDDARAAVLVSRARDGQLAGPKSGTIASSLELLNFPAQLANATGGSAHGQTTLQVRPPAPTSGDSPGPIPTATPPTQPVPTAVDIIDNGANGVMVIADGSNSRGIGRGGRVGGRPGSGQHGSQVTAPNYGSLGSPPSIEVMIEATFDAHGQLVHELYRETFVRTSPGTSQTVQRSVSIDRVATN